MSGFKEFLTYRSLDQKYSYSHGIDTIQRLIDSGDLFRVDENGHQVLITDIEEAHPGFIKNLCAKVPAVLVDQLDQVSANLGINKRDFIERALWDAVQQAREIYSELGVDEYLFSTHDEKLEYPKAPNLEVLK